MDQCFPLQMNQRFVGHRLNVFGLNRCRSCCPSVPLRQSLLYYGLERIEDCCMVGLRALHQLSHFALYMKHNHQQKILLQLEFELHHSHFHCFCKIFNQVLEELLSLNYYDPNTITMDPFFLQSIHLSLFSSHYFSISI